MWFRFEFDIDSVDILVFLVAREFVVPQLPEKASRVFHGLHLISHLVLHTIACKSEYTMVQLCVSQLPSCH